MTISVRAPMRWRVAGDRCQAPRSASPTDGELLVKRDALTFAGYQGKARDRHAFTADGHWLKTGDLAALGQNGRLRLVGRK